MSWLARSIANSLRLDDDEDESNHQHLSPKAEDDKNDSKSDPSSPTTPERGVKEDLSELKKTLTRQLWGVASFLAPPPQSQIPDPSAEHLDPESSDAEAVAGIRNDFAEIGGRFRSGISKLSSNIAVTEFSKIASNFLQLGAEEEGYGSAEGAVGVTDEVVAFVKDIAMHPETWLDFPLPDDEEDDDDFDLSDAQQEHALAVERLAPRLAALRMELCPGYMSEESFWKIYFVLLHPRLSKHDALLLSTPQVMEARASLTLELNNRNKGKQQQEERSAQFISSSSEPIGSLQEDISVPSNAKFESVPLDVQAIEVTTFPVNAEPETVKHQIQTSDIPIDKSVVQEGPISSSKDHNTSYAGSSSKVSEDNYEDDGDDWLKEETSEVTPASGTRVPIENDEDVSFSDLEDDDDGDVPTSYKKVTYGSDSSTKDSRDWVQLGRSSTDSTKDSNTARARNPDTKESNDWLDVDEIVDVE